MYWPILLLTLLSYVGLTQMIKVWLLRKKWILDKEGQHSSWVLGHATNESARLSDQQLSEYLLKPVLSCASIN
jgi:hypothetical protein